MLLIMWLGFVFEVLFFSLIKGFIQDWEVASILFIGVHFIFTFIGIVIYKSKYKLIFIISYLLRLIAMFWDIYGKKIFTLIGSGGDSEGFFRSAVKISQNLELLTDDIYGGVYSKILGVFSYFVFPDRILLQYINVIIGLTIIIILHKILKTLDINEKIIKYSIIVLAIIPNSIINSGILIRENFIILFVTISFYQFIKWYKYGHLLNIILSILSLLMASAFHSGVIGIIIGYIFALFFYDKKKDKLRFNIRTVPLFIISIISLNILYKVFDEVFLGEFSNVESVDDIISVANSGRGGSEYLKGLNMNSRLQIILFGPIKMLYFLISPLPMYWRGLGDIIAFMTDGLIYLYLITNSLKKYIKIKIKDPIIINVLVTLLSVVFIFGIGISNAGTAIRHRNKILVIFIVFNAIVVDRIKKQREEIPS